VTTHKEMPLLRGDVLVATWTLAAWLMAAAAFAGGATPARADQTSGQGLGSVDEYERSARLSADGYESPLLGIGVENETEWLGHGRWLEHGRWVRGHRA
jgi:hypothetical protein